jgi:hypothetical protein
VTPELERLNNTTAAPRRIRSLKCGLKLLAIDPKLEHRCPFQAISEVSVQGNRLAQEIFEDLSQIDGR